MFDHTIAAQRQPHQRLDTERIKRRLDPVCVPSEHIVSAAGQLANGTNAIHGEDTRFPARQ